jgi:putative hemolysin
MNSKTILLGMISGLLLMSGFSRQSYASDKVGMAGPASVYCAQSGYKPEIRTRPDGSQYSVCLFSDGKECEERTFFRGECGVEYRKPQVPRTEGFCRSDGDCACGIHVKTGKCFYGNKLYVNAEKQCPDFCSGFAGNLTIHCVNDECRQVPAQAQD